MVKTLYTYYLNGDKNSETRAAVAAYGNKIAEIRGLKKPETPYQAISIAIDNGIDGIPAPSYQEYKSWK